MPKDEKIGIPADYIDLPGLRKKYSGIQFVTKSTVVDGLAAVDSGELFAMLAFTPTLSLYTQRNYEGSLKISGNFKNDTAKLAIATSADSVVLKSIVDASLESVPNSRRQNIYNKWVAVSIHRQVDYVLLKKLAIPLVVLASFLCFNLWQQRKHRKQIELKNSQLEEMNNLLSQKNAAAMHMAHHDPLTGLCNRAKLLDDLDSLLKVSKRSSAQFGCMFLDLDRFKAVNDTMGHSAGDELLKRVAERISNTLRETDTLYRVGGDEFMVLMQAFVSGYSPSIVARRLIHCLAEPFIIEGKTVSIGTSIGIAVCPDDTTDHEELLKFADSAMYVAKANGRNGFHFHDGVLSDQISRITEVEAALREQSPEQAFHLEFQPIIDLRTGLAEKAEALIRWNHPRLGQIQPEEFIPIAEEAGLINSIGEWVLRESCKSMRDIQNSGCNISSIAINVSSKEFSAGDLVGRFRDTLSSFDLKAEQVEIEICEQYMQEFSSAAKLGALRALGHKICIDNFGSGSFSLLYVHSLPLSTLKLDRVFVRNLPASPNDVAIAQAILSLASSLGYKVVAEGVETAEQLAFLRGMKCDYVQGFYFCKPLPLDKFVGRVAEINARQGFNDAGLSQSANDDGEDSTIAV